MAAIEFDNLLGIPELNSYLRDVERALKKIIIDDNSSLKEPSLRMVINSGKRLRPFLVIAAAKSQYAKINEAVISCCAAIELVHVGTIIHDDIIDDANFRWGAPTINSQEGTSQAILVGDYLLALANAIAASISKDFGYLIAKTIATMCDGQGQETNDEYNIDRTIESYYSAINKKTASLTAAACRAGGLCAGSSKTKLDRFTDFGRSFGMSYQIIDDLLDIFSTTEIMGKPVGNDIKEGIYTLPVLLALQSSQSKKIRSWLGKNPQRKPEKSEIMESLSASGAIETTILEIQKHTADAAKSAKSLGKNKITEGLSILPETYMDWALKKAQFQ